MTVRSSALMVLTCLDTPEMAAYRRLDLEIPTTRAAELGWSAVEAAELGYYTNRVGEEVEWSKQVRQACGAKLSIGPEAPLPTRKRALNSLTRVQAANLTTLQASLRLVQTGLKPLALNFANGIQPGSGFLFGARAQEEVLCRSSALYSTLVDDPPVRKCSRTKDIQDLSWYRSRHRIVRYNICTRISEYSF